MNKYFTMLTKAVIGIIAGIGAMCLDPTTIGIMIIIAGLIWAGMGFLKAK